jgi:hypothetical protein
MSKVKSIKIKNTSTSIKVTIPKDTLVGKVNFHSKVKLPSTKIKKLDEPKKIKSYSKKY